MKLVYILNPSNITGLNYVEFAIIKLRFQNAIFFNKIKFSC